MTYWFVAWCPKCKCESPTLFVTSGPKISLYVLDDNQKADAANWILDHDGHDAFLLNTDDDRRHELLDTTPQGALK